MTTDKPIRLSLCSQCQSPVYACQVSGIRVMADVVPLPDIDAIRNRMIEKRPIYRVIRLGNRPHKLQWVAPEFVKRYADEILGDHECEAVHRHGVRVEAVPVGPLSAPVSCFRPSDGHDPQTAHDHGSQGRTAVSIMEGSSAPPNPALRVTRPRIKPTRCDVCDKIITVDTENVWTIEYDGRFVYARHDAC